MRWLIGHPGPHFSVHDVYEGWIEGLRACGEQVFTFNLGDRLTFYDAALMESGITDSEGRIQARKALTRQQAIELATNGMLAAAYKCWPDVVLAVSAFFTPSYMLDMMRSRGHKIVLLHTECPYQDDEQLLRAGHADINLLNDPVSLPKYEALSRAAYMPHAYRPSVHYPAGPGMVPEWDLSFVGTGFPSRVRFFQSMDLAGLKVKIAGPWEDPAQWADFDHEDCVDNTETAGIYRASRCGINLYRREGEETWDGSGVAVGPREVELAACGLYFLRDSRPESDELFPMLPAYTSPAEASEQLRWALTHPGTRAEAAAKARAVITDRTFTNHARKLLAMLDN